MAKLTRKSYKRKKIAFAAVILGGVALVSSGFAAWVLSANATKGTTGVTTVGTVKDNSLSMSIELQYQNPKTKEWEKQTTSSGEVATGTFDFDPTYEDTRDTKGRVYNDGINFERLTLRYVFVISSKDDKSFDKLNVKMEEDLTENEASKIDAAVQKNYVIAPVCYSSIGLDILGTDSSQFTPGHTGSSEADKLYTWTINYDVSFEWGSFFSKTGEGEGTNPGIYFDSPEGLEKYKVLGTVNDKMPTDTKETPTVSAILNDLHTILDNASYKLTFTAFAK